MNEDQPHNDHKLHIASCVCGNKYPEVMGDDFDADVSCNICHRYTDGYGTKGAIHKWNNNIDIQQMVPDNKEIPKVNIELPNGDNRMVKVLRSEWRDGELHVCITVSEKEIPVNTCPRKRKKTVLDDSNWHMPAPFTVQDVEDRMDSICGCAGRNDCDCDFIRNTATGQLWYEHNIKS